MARCSLPLASKVGSQQKISNKELGVRADCIQVLQQLLDAARGNLKVRAFGSCASGFATTGCDLDVTCLCPPAHAWRSASSQLQALLPLLRRHKRFTVLEVVLGARIPIVKLRFDGGLDVDLSWNNWEAVRNTNLLRAYSALDPRISDLVVAVKLWAQGEGLCGAACGCLSSYAWSMLVLYYLQCDPATRLQCLDTETHGEDPHGVSNAFWQCELSLKQLYEGFFKFFARGFAWGSEVVSVRLGVRSERTHEIWRPLKGAAMARLHVEDPYLRSRNLNCTLDLRQEQMMRSKLQSVCRGLDLGSQRLFPHASERLVDGDVEGTVSTPLCAGKPLLSDAASTASPRVGSFVAQVDESSSEGEPPPAAGEWHDTETVIRL